MKTISDVRSISKVTTDRILVHDTLGGSFSAHIFDNVIFSAVYICFNVGSGCVVMLAYLTFKVCLSLFSCAY